MKIFFSISFLLFIAGRTIAIGDENRFYVTPSFTFGYTFHAGMNVGWRLSVGIIKPIHDQEIKYGITFGKTWVKNRKVFDKITFMTVNAGIQQINVGAGFGSIKHRWGYSKRNKCKTFGVVYEANVYAPSKVGLYAGVQRFTYSNASWAWFNKPYNTLYIGSGYSLLPSTSKSLQSK